MKHPIFVQKTMGGSAAGPPVDLATALTKEWTFDAHTVQYEGTIRLNRGEGELRIVVELYDFDNKALPDAARAVWAQACLAKLPAGFCGYRTAGGFRALTLRETPFIVNDAEQWEEWRQYHGGRAEALGAIIGAAPDHATDEPNRLFRLPMALREDGKPRYPELYGEIGYATLAPAPYVRRAASEIYVDGDASHSMVGAAFTAARLTTGRSGQKLNVTCPWQHTHSGGKGGGTFVDDTEDHMGHFVCAHSHCQGRTSWDALDALRALPGVAAELAHWPEPTNVLVPYARVEEVAPQAVLSAPAARANFQLMTADDMGLDTPIPWVIDGLVSVGEPTMIVGGAGSGKTSAMVALALSVATSQPVWGRFAVTRPGPVVHIDYEQGKTLRRTYRAFARGQGLDATELVRKGALRIAPLPVEQLLDANVTDKHLSSVGKDLVELCTGASVCVINSLTASTNKVNENDAKIAAVFNLCARVTEATGCAFIVLHHSGRADTLRARGSSAIDGAVQTIFQIGHRPGDAHTIWTHKKDRPAGGLQEAFKLVWAVDGDGQTLTVEELKDEMPEPGAERPEDRIAKAVLFVMKHKGLSGKDRVLECVRGQKVVKRAVWDDLLVSGTIEHVGSRYLVSAGVLVPSKQPDGVREEDDMERPK